MGKCTISMAIFNSFLYVYQRVVIVGFHGIIWGYFMGVHGILLRQQWEYHQHHIQCGAPSYKLVYKPQ